MVASARTPSRPQDEFLRRRLALLGRVLFTLTLVGLVVATLAARLVPALRHPSWPSDPYSALMLVMTALFGAEWVLASRKRLPTLALHALDAGTSVAMGCAVAAMVMVGLLATGFEAWASGGVSIMLTARAALLPSTRRRTFWIGVGASAPTIVGTYVALAHLSQKPDPSHALATATVAGIMLFLSVLVQTATSFVIYGLRREVHAARQLGQYTLEEKVGSGGMGTVFRARHALLRRPTAVKLLASERTAMTDLARFEREVQRTAQLAHPNIITVYDYGQTPDGVFYYAMEYLDGASLSQIVELDGAQPEGRVIRILRQVAEALAEAHAVGLIHRDIKPQNIIVYQRGRIPDVAKVLDFGLVKDIKGGRGTSLTMPETLTGTPAFMAPEALTHPDRVDGRSDLYALGAVGYFLLTGQHVFNGNNIVEICGHHLHTAPVPPSQRLGASFDPKLEELLLRCLAKSQQDRPQSADEVVQCLASIPLASAWTDDLARRWWGEHREPLAALRKERAQRPVETTVAVDWSMRVMI